MENLMVNVVEEVKTLDSREVAKMCEMRHDLLLRKIDGINESLVNHKIEVHTLWQETNYINPTNNKPCRKFDITKKGCEFLANKLTGDKGNIFTFKYVDRFAKMEKTIKQNNLLENYLNMTEEERGIIYFKTLKERKELAVQNEIKNKLLIESKIKTDVFDNFINSSDLYSINDVSKILAIKNLGRNNFYKYLRDNKILMKDTYTDYKGKEHAGIKNFEAYAKYVNGQEYFVHRSRKTNCGRKIVNQNVAMFTPKGIDWIIKKLKKDEYIVIKSIEEVINELKSL